MSGVAGFLEAPRNIKSFGALLAAFPPLPARMDPGKFEALCALRAHLVGDNVAKGWDEMLGHLASGRSVLLVAEPPEDVAPPVRPTARR